MINRIQHSWSFQMKLAKGSYNKFHKILYFSKACFAINSTLNFAILIFSLVKKIKNKQKHYENMPI